METWYLGTWALSFFVTNTLFRKFRSFGAGRRLRLCVYERKFVNLDAIHLDWGEAGEAVDSWLRWSGTRWRHGGRQRHCHKVVAMKIRKSENARMADIMWDGCKVLQLHIVGTLQFIILKNVLLSVGRIVPALQLAAVAAWLVINVQNF